MGYVLLFFLGVMAVEFAATTLTTVDLLEWPRSWFKSKFPKLGKLATCRLCQCFWMSLAFGLAFPSKPFLELLPDWYCTPMKDVLIWLACAGLATMWAEARERYLNRAPDSKFVRAIVRMEKEPTGPSEPAP